MMWDAMEMRHETKDKGISSTRYNMENEASRNCITKWTRLNQKVTNTLAKNGKMDLKKLH
jgi:hypothetical protein